MSPDIFSDRKLISRAVELAVEKTKGVSLTKIRTVGDSYPYRPDVPGVWVRGPDREGRYAVDVHVVLAVAGITIPEMADKLRAKIWEQLRGEQLHEQGINMADRVTSIDIYVEDLVIAV